MSRGSENMPNNYYTFIEIVLYLRKEYQKCQKLLDEMTALIEVEDIDASKELEYQWKRKTYDNSNLPALYLKVKRKQKTIEKKLNAIIEVFTGYDEQQNRKNYVKFILKNGDIPKFVDSSLSEDKSFYNPNVYIAKPKEFKEWFQEFQNIELSKTETSLMLLNEFQDVDIDGKGIFLTTIEGLENTEHSVSISYNPKLDEIRLKQTKKNNPYVIERLLKTKIPRYELPEKIREIIENGRIIDDPIVIEKREYQKEDILTPKIYRKR